MSKVPPFHSIHEPDNLYPRYHTDTDCPVGGQILQKDMRAGSGGFSQCEQCAKSNALERASARPPSARPSA